MNDSNHTLILLPTYNEAGNLACLVRDLRDLNAHWQILIVDDASPDGTGAIADALAREISYVEVMHRKGKLGLGSAHQCAMDKAIAAGCQVLVTMDVDYTHRPEDVGRLLYALENGPLDVVVGSRYGSVNGIRAWPLWRRVISRSAHLSTKYLLGIPVDATSAFRAYRVDALARTPYREVRGDGYAFMFEMLMACMRCGLKVGDVGVEMPFRNEGESKISRAEIFRGLTTLARLTLKRILRCRNRPSTPQANG